MSDILNVTGSNYTSGSIERGESSVQLNTGALRRKYNFGNMVSNLLKEDLHILKDMHM